MAWAAEKAKSQAWPSVHRQQAKVWLRQQHSTYSDLGAGAPCEICRSLSLAKFMQKSQAITS